MFSLPIYLHFLDRELRRSVSSTLNDDEMKNLIFYSSLCTNDYMYLSLSLIYENINEFPKSINFLINYDKLKNVVFLSSQASSIEFLYHKREQYKHVKLRYARYFNENEITISNIQTPTGNSTQTIKKDILNWSQGIETSLTTDNSIFSKKSLKYIEKKTKRNEDKALTIDLFKKLKKVEKLNTQKLISESYTSKQIKERNGSLLKNIPFIHYYDDLSEFGYDINLLFKIMEYTNIGSYLKNKNLMSDLIAKPEFDTFKLLFQDCFAWMQANYLNHEKEVKQFQRVIRVNSNDEMLGALALFCNNLRVLNHRGFLMNSDTVLIVVATDTELHEVVDKFNSRVTAQLLNKNGLTFYSLGTVNTKNFYVIKSGMGMSGQSGSIISVKSAIDILQPNSVIMVGIAFGLHNHKQKIGDVIVSKQVTNYDFVKQKESGTIERADKAHSSTQLLSLFENSKITFNNNVDFGLFICGEKLLDNESMVKELLNRFPEALAGDMESYGVYSICEKQKIDWLIIKGICDWGFEKQSEHKKEDQKLAIKNAVDFLRHTYQEVTFI